MSSSNQQRCFETTFYTEKVEGYVVCEPKSEASKKYYVL